MLWPRNIETQGWVQGFAETDWGFPDTGLWQRHAHNLAKEQLRQLWVAQLDQLDQQLRMRRPADGSVDDDAAPVAATTATTTDHRRPMSAEGTIGEAAEDDDDDDDDAGGGGITHRHADGVAGAQPTAVLGALDLRDRDCTRDAPLLKVVEALGVNTLKHYLSHALPQADADSVFASAAVRARWVEDAVQDECKTMGEAARQLMFYQLAAQQRRWTVEGEQRQAHKAQAREKARKIEAWLQKQSHRRRRGLSPTYEQLEQSVDELTRDEISVTDVAVEMVKSKLKDELKDVVVDLAEEFWQRHWPLVCGIAIPCVALPAAVAVKILRMP
jgi:hypothetical protein